ncbi:MAG: hypothetical protein AAF694_17470 [Bacteroidota bacterium]
MMGQETFEIRITGTRQGELLTPELLDVSEWIEIFTHGRNLLFPEKSRKDSPKVTVRIESGSVRLLFMTNAADVIQVQALIGKIALDRTLNQLPKKQAEALRYFQGKAREEQLDIRLGRTDQMDRGLHFSSKTDFLPEESAWVEVEILICGRLVNAGGKTKPNIHLDTEEFGVLIIETSETILAAEEQNRLYQQQQVQIRILQNAFTGEYDTKSAQLVAFVDHNEAESPDSYLDRLIQAAASNWKRVKDKESWVKEIRGYGN